MTSPKNACAVDTITMTQEFWGRLKTQYQFMIHGKYLDLTYSYSNTVHTDDTENNVGVDGRELSSERRIIRSDVILDAFDLQS